MHPVMTEMLAAERIREMVARGRARKTRAAQASPGGRAPASRLAAAPPTRRGMPGKARRSIVSGGDSGRL